MANKALILSAGLFLALAAALAIAADEGQTPQLTPPPGRPPLLMDQVWMDRLELAYQRNDRVELGRLVTEMKMKRGQAFMKGESAARPTPPPAEPPGPRSERGPTLSSKPLAKNDNEAKILAVLDEMDMNQRQGMMNVPMDDGRLLRLLVETTGAKSVVEVGTSNGYSGIWTCLALRHVGGKLTTFEINAERAALARENFKRAGVETMVTLVEGDAHEKVKDLKDPIDVLFLDADKEGYIDYLEKLLPLVRPGGLVLAHNLTPRMADPAYLKAITENPDLETLFLGSSMGVTLKKR